MKINISVNVPERVKHPAIRRRTIHEKVAEAINNIDSGCELVDDDWELLFKVKKELQKRSELSDSLQYMLDKILDIEYKYDRTEDVNVENSDMTSKSRKGLK